MKLHCICAGLLAVCAVLKAADGSQNTAAQLPARSASLGPAIGSDYVLQPRDQISVEVFQEPDLKQLVSISQEGTIVLLLIDKVDLTGKTLRQARDLIRDLYARFLVNPQVNLLVISHAPRTVNVIGEVVRPGLVPFPEEQGLRLVDAIAAAGGPTQLAKMTGLVLTRTHPDGTVETNTINAMELINASNAKNINAWPLMTNDTIYVPQIFFLK